MEADETYVLATIRRGHEHLREVTGGDCTAKDFRTWKATV